MLRTMILLTLTLPLAGQQGPAAGSDEPARLPLYRSLGTWSHPISTPRESAQRYFDQGLRLIYAFNHAEARRSFAEAERLDPRCAMCAWGVALSLSPNLNAPMAPADESVAREAIERAADPGMRATPRERRYIAAMAARLAGPGDRSTRDSAYADAMAEVARTGPEDADAQVLYADALMNLSPWNYWEEDGTPRPATGTVLQHLERVLASQPEHPGACHLFIHAVEAHSPERAVRCAERLARLMPGAGHIVHMPGHIYIRVGRYHDAVRANEHAVHADQTFLEGAHWARRGLYAQGYYPHNWHFMAFAASMAGERAVAIDAARRTAAALDPDVALSVGWLEAVTPVLYWTLVTFGAWDAILAEPMPAPQLRFATGMAYYARGVAFAARARFSEALAALDSVTAIAGSAPAGDLRTALRIAGHALRGEVALRRGWTDDAVRQFALAVRLEDSLAYNEPPTWYYPMRHSLGAALLAAGRPAEAERVYEEDLRQFPGNGWSLFGLMQSLTAQDRFEEARAVRERFTRAWRHADVTLTGSRF